MRTGHFWLVLLQENPGWNQTTAQRSEHRCEYVLFVLCIGDGAGTVRAWDWRRAGGGAVASARGHVGSVTAVTSLHSSRADVAASAGVDGVVRVLSLDGADGACIIC